MFAIFNYDTDEVMYISHDKGLLEEILMDIWKDDTYYEFCYNCKYLQFDSLQEMANEVWDNALNYNLNYLTIITLPQPID